jgi:hypothetical protein
MKTLTLSDGTDVNIYPVPAYLINLVTTKYPEPKPPKRKINPEAAIPGVTDDDLIDDPENPAYLLERQEWLVKRTHLFVDTRLLYGLKDEKPPDGWPTEHDISNWEFFGIAPEIPKNGPGRRLAWIKYGLMKSGKDLDFTLAAIDALSSAEKEEVQAVIDSFRHSGQRDAAL